MNSFKSIDLEHLSSQMLLAGTLIIKAAMVKLGICYEQKQFSKNYNSLAMVVF